MELLQAMQAFARVAELGSFTRAADELALSRAMVSTHVRRLERRFGVKLLNRTTRKVAVTPAGADYLGHCRRVFAELAEAQETLRRGREQPTGSLRIDVPGSFGRHLLLPALPEFLARYPGIEVELRFNERIATSSRSAWTSRCAEARSPTRTSSPGRLPARAGFSARPRPTSREAAGPSPSPISPDTRSSGSITADTAKPRPWLFPDGVTPPAKLEFGVTINEMEAVMLARRTAPASRRLLDLMAARALMQGELQIVLPDCTLPGPMLSVVHTPAAQRPRPGAGFFRISCATSSGRSRAAPVRHRPCRRSRVIAFWPHDGPRSATAATRPGGPPPGRATISR
jgi:DNA-binding transcriptional LysR family regulator